MKRILLRTLVLVTLSLVAIPAPARAAAGEPLRLVKTIPLPDVVGRIDHLAVDVARQRVFVAALGNGSVEVLDLEAGTRIHSLRGLKEPQGMVYVPGLDRLFVACGGDGSVRVYDGTSYDLLNTIKLASDADNVRYDSSSQLVYAGYDEGAIAILDARTRQKEDEIPVSGHPESFQLERNGPRIFVNVPTAHRIEVLDRQKLSNVANWHLATWSENFPMALDEADHRLFIGCRRPPVVWVLDSHTGKQVTVMASAGDADDLFYDALHKRLYLSGGQGFLDVYEQHDPDHYRLLAQLKTAPGARTSLFIPDLARLCLAVPRRGEQSAEVRVYAVEP